MCKIDNSIVESYRGVAGGGGGRMIKPPQATGFRGSKIEILSEKTNFIRSTVFNY